jgi:uncharacterized protein
VIVADTGGILALLDRDDRHHARVRRRFEEEGRTWILPWAILPDVDFIAARRLGAHVALALARDVRNGLLAVDAHLARDLPRALELLELYGALKLGLVDAVVMAQAERHRARVFVSS